MKFKSLIFFCTFLLNEFTVNAQEQVMALDSLYRSSIHRFYTDAGNVKSAIWEEMELAPVCMYRTNGPALLYNHPNPPENFVKVTDKLYVGAAKGLQLFGATQMEINGTLTAIVDYELDHYACPTEVYAELFHELHHVYQRNSVEHIGFDNPAVLLTYPENYLNDGLKLFEQNILYQMCFTQTGSNFQKLMNQFYSCRLKREQFIGNFIRYEETVESMEVPAFYCEYKFYNKFSPFSEALKNNYNQKHFFGFLTTPFYGREGLRNRHLAAGMAMCIILDQHFDHWQKDYYSGTLSLYDFFISKFRPKQVDLEIDPMYYDLSEFHVQEAVMKHQASFNDFNTQQGIKIMLQFNQRPQFKGFDPMHAEAINDSTILHKTLLRLSGGENDKLFINNKNSVTIVDGEIWVVKKVVLFAPAESVLLQNDRLVIDTEGENISWEGKLKKKTQKEIIFDCE